MSSQASWKLRFFTIWTGQQLSQVGTIIGRFALIWWLTRETGSAVVLTNATMVSLAPSILLMPFVGPLIDRWNRRIVILISDSFIALVSLWLAYLFWSGSMQVWHVYVVMLLRSFGSIFHGPAFSASIPLMVPEQHLVRIQGMGFTLNGVRGIIGPGLGALCMELLPLHGIMMIDVFTAVLAVFPLLLLAIPQPDHNHIERIRSASYFANLKEGLLFVLHWPGLLILLGGVALIKVAVSPALSLTPLLIFEHFGLSSVEYGMCQSFSGAGVILGGFILTAWGGFKRKIFTILMGFAGLGLGVSLMGFLSGEVFWPLLAMCAFVSIMTVAFNAPTQAILMASIPKHIQGRVFTLFGCLVSLTTPIGLAIAGPLAERVGVPFLFKWGGILCAVIAGLGFFVPALRRMETRYADEIE
jgi:MFS transporter, DHA3 family, macrolide efflux protein